MRNLGLCNLSSLNCSVPYLRQINSLEIRSESSTVNSFHRLFSYRRPDLEFQDLLDEIRGLLLRLEGILKWNLEQG